MTKARSCGTSRYKLVMANQPDMVVVDKHPKKAVVINVSIPNDSHMKRKQHKKSDNASG